MAIVIILNIQKQKIYKYNMFKKVFLKNIIKYFYENLAILNNENKPANSLIIGAEYQEPHIGLFILSNIDKSFNTIYLKVDAKYKNSESNLSKNINFVLEKLPYNNNSLDNIYFDNNVFKFIEIGVNKEVSKHSLISIINKLKPGGNLYIPFESYGYCLNVFINMLDIKFNESEINLYDVGILFLKYKSIVFPVFYDYLSPLGSKYEIFYEYKDGIDKSEYYNYLNSTKLDDLEKHRYEEFLKDKILAPLKNIISRKQYFNIFIKHKDEILRCNIQVIESILQEHFNIESVEIIEPLFKKTYTSDKSKNYTYDLPWMKCIKKSI